MNPAHSKQSSCHACWAGSGPTPQTHSSALGSSSSPFVLLRQQQPPHAPGLTLFCLKPLHSRSTGITSLKIILCNTHRIITRSIYNPVSLGLDRVSTGSIRNASSGIEQPLAQNTWNTLCDCQEGTGKGGGKWWKEMCIRKYLWDFQCSTQDTFRALSSIHNSKHENCYFKPAVSDTKPLTQEHHKECCTELILRLAYFQHLPHWVKANLAVQTLCCG